MNQPIFQNLEAEHFKVKAVSAVLASQWGHMWMSTDKGLGLYNGYHTPSYAPDSVNKENGPLSIKLMEFYETRDGNLWFGYMDKPAISCFNPVIKKFIHFEHDTSDINSFPYTVVSRFHEDSKGTLWCGTWDGGFVKFNKERTKLTRYQVEEGRSDWLITNAIRVIQEFEPDKYLMGNFDEGQGKPGYCLRIFDARKNTCSLFPIEEYRGNLSDKAFIEIIHILRICHFIYQDKKNNKLWVGTYSGLVMIDLKNKYCKRISGKKFDENYTINLDNTINYTLDENGRLWVSTTNSGIMIVDTQTNKAFYSSHRDNCTDCVGDNKILGFTKDNDGNIWVNQASRGVSIYYPFKNKFKLVTWEKLHATFSNASGQNIPVTFMLPRNNKHLYFCSSSGIGIYDYQTDSLMETIENHNDYKGKGLIKNVWNFKLHNNKLYYGITLPNGGAHTAAVYDLKSRKILSATKNHIFNICFPSDTLDKNVYTQSVYYKNLFKFNAKGDLDTFHIFPDNKFPGTAFSYYLNNGKWFFFRNSNSFVIFDPHTKETILYSSKQDGDKNFPDSTITNYCYNKKGVMWITTRNGLYSYHEKTGEIKSWNKELGIDRSTIFLVAEDENENLWLAIGKEIYRYNFTQKKLLSYSKAIGLPSYGFENYGNYLYCTRDSNNLFFPTDKGLLYFNTGNINLPQTQPVVHLYQLKVSDSLANDALFIQATNQYLTLAYNQNNLQFYFATNQLITPFPNRFLYRVNELHNDWQASETDNKINLYNLPSGTYTLRVKCINTYGLESEEWQITINISKPFWLQWWFILSCIGMVAVLIYFLIKQREKKLLLRQQELESTVTERTQEVMEKARQIEIQKEMLEQKQEEILDSIYYARRIQNALLAGENLLNNNLPCYFIYYQPKDIVSGDFYWATKISQRFYFVVADSTGHGVPGAFMSLLNINYLNEAINEKQIEKPGEILDYVRSRLIKSLSENNKTEGGNDGMDCTIICLNTENNTIEYAGAHNPLLLFREKTLQVLETDRMPVGKSPRQEIQFTNHVLKLQKGDSVYLVTDGYSDQFGGEKGKKLKFKNFKNYLTEISPLNPDVQRELLEESFNKWKGELEQIDDVCVVGIFF